jgi:hypothetical protein
MNDQPNQDVQSAAIPQQPDGSGFILHFTGGVRAGQIDKDVWKIDPFLADGRPVIKGPFSTAALQAFSAKHKLSGIAFESMGWTNGSYHSSWTPINPTRKNHFLGPADLWRNISSNITRGRTDEKLRAMVDPTHEKLAALLDDRADAERLAQSISLSLRSVDISIGQIAKFYHEQLVDSIASGALNGQRRATSLDQTLYAHVHSFFMHLGAARDYLAAFAGVSLGKDTAKIDSLARLTEIIRCSHFGSSSILQLLRSKGFLAASSTNENRWEASGWLRDMSIMRNQYVHKRPYGEMFFERMGHARVVDAEQGVYRYFRPIVIDKNADRDLLDVISDHYREATVLFEDAAQASGFDAAILSITDKEIISLEMDPKR